MIKKLSIFVGILFITSNVFAASVPQKRGLDTTWKIQEEDGTPFAKGRTLKVSNGSLTDNADGTYSFATGTASPSATYGVASNTAANKTSYAYQCDGTDDQVQIQAAIDAADANGGGLVQLSEGTFNIDEAAASPTQPIIITELNVSLVGSKSGVTILKMIASAGRYKGILGGDETAGSPTDDQSNVTISGIEFDHNVANNLPADFQTELTTYPRWTYKAKTGSNINFIHNVVRNEVSTNTIVMSGAVDVTDSVVAFNKFINMGDDYSTYDNDHSSIYFHGDRMIVSDNIFQCDTWEPMAAIEVHGTDIQVTNNDIYGYERGMNITGIYEHDGTGHIITGNTMTTSGQGIVLFSSVLSYGSPDATHGLVNTLISGNSVEITQATNYTGTAGIQGIGFDPSASLPVRQVNIVGNNVTFEEESIAAGYTYSSNTYGIGVSTAGASFDWQDSVIQGNTIVNSPNCAIQVLAKKIDNLSLLENTIINPCQTKDADNSTITRSAIYIGGATLEITNGIFVRNNRIIDNFATTRMFQAFRFDNAGTSDLIESTGNVVRVTGSTTTAYVDNYAISDNDVQPRILDDDFWTWIAPGETVLVGSRVIDSAVGAVYSLAATGTGWVAQFYGDIAIDTSGNMSSVGTITAGVITADGLTMDANENITLGAQTLDHDGTDFVMNDSLAVGGSGTTAFGGDVTITGDINPEADGTRDLGTQTTAQWANVWSDLINGADYAFLNSFRLLESEKYEGYPEGLAVGNQGFTPGQVEPTASGTPIFAITEEFIEFQGVRITPDKLRKLLQ